MIIYQSFDIRATTCSTVSACGVDKSINQRMQRIEILDREDIGLRKFVSRNANICSSSCETIWPIPGLQYKRGNSSLYNNSMRVLYQLCDSFPTKTQCLNNVYALAEPTHDNDSRQTTKIHRFPLGGSPICWHSVGQNKYELLNIEARKPVSSWLKHITG